MYALIIMALNSFAASEIVAAQTAPRLHQLLDVSLVYCISGSKRLAAATLEKINENKVNKKKQGVMDLVSHPAISVCQPGKWHGHVCGRQAGRQAGRHAPTLVSTLPSAHATL